MRLIARHVLRGMSLVVAVAAFSGCGGGGSDGAIPLGVDSASTPPGAAEQTTEVVTNDGARLRITLAVGGVAVGDPADLCGPAEVPVTLTVVNLADRPAPFPPVHLDTTAADGARQRTLVRDGAGECSVAPRAAPLGSGQTAVFKGSTPAGGGRIEVRISETNFVLAVARP